MKIVYILRALPGQGKSTLAKLLAKGNNAVIISLDQFHMIGGVYQYNPDPQVIKGYLLTAVLQFIEYLKNGVEIIIIDCVNETQENVDTWRIPALKAGYQVVILEIPHEDPKILAERNTHGVPSERIEKKLLRWDYVGYTMPWKRFWRKIKKMVTKSKRSW
jgi:predicted kinase